MGYDDLLKTMMITAIFAVKARNLKAKPIKIRHFGLTNPRLSGKVLAV
jgi:hypothetical protein